MSEPDKTTAELAALQEEITRLRAALAQSDSPCVYCSLSKEDWGKCRSGFPGCARGDDAMGCPHLGAALELEHIRATTIEECAKIADIWASTKPTSGEPAPLIASIVSATGSRIAEAIRRLLNKEAPQ